MLPPCFTTACAGVFRSYLTVRGSIRFDASKCGCFNKPLYNVKEGKSVPWWYPDRDARLSGMSAHASATWHTRVLLGPRNLMRALS